MPRQRPSAPAAHPDPHPAGGEGESAASDFPGLAHAGRARGPSRQQSEGEGQSAQVCVGVVAGAHGVRGAVRLKSFTAIPEDIARYGPLRDESGTRRFRLHVLGAAKGALLARLDDVSDRDQAEALKGLRLYLPRAALPPPKEEEYYHADLLGLAACLGDGREIGRVRAIHDFGAGDTIEIERPAGPPVLVPFTRAVVPLVDLAAGRLVLDPPPGLLATAEAEP
jgi:16S rRNA processing protein RimM